MFQAGQLAAANTSFVSAREAVVARVEESAQSIATLKARRQSNKLLLRALKAWKRGETVPAAQMALEATNADETNAQAFSLLAITLEKLGHLHKALVTYEKAHQLDPNDPDLLLNIGLTVWNAGNANGAESMFRQYIEKRPESPEGYNNLASVLRDKGEIENAIELIRGAIYRIPDQPMLWNTLATVLNEDGRVEDGLVFYQEALRLDPSFARVWHNLGYAYIHLGRCEESLDAYDRALALSTNHHERIEALHSRSICLMAMGKLDEGFREYEVRNHHEFRTFVAHHTKAPRWRGEPLESKRMLVVGEQGLGDEVMFANVLPDLARQVGERGKLQIAVDPRLIPIFKRSFPLAEVGRYEHRKLDGMEVRICPWALTDGGPDYYASFGTPLHLLRKSISDFPKQAYLRADDARTSMFRARLAALGPGPYVGVCWRSMVLGAKRRKYFSAIEGWGPILSTPGVTFVNLQYGEVRAELDIAREKFGVTIHNFADLNLKDDLDGAAALTSACDLVLSAPTAAAAMAGALGKEVWFLVAAPVWPQLGTDHYPWYAKSRVIACEKFADWDTLMPKVRDELICFAKR
jgi:tetratricopeptide (TPR) repeat protein